MASTKCKDCGCVCPKCTFDHDVHLHVEIENLKQQLLEKHNHIVTMETNFLNEANKYPNGELLALHDELLTWQDKYKRLYDGHRRIQRVNQGLEDKLLRLVDITETDKNTLTKDIATLSYKLAEANYSIKKLTEDNERYKNDVAVAIQFLQCKPGNFVAQKFDTLPNEVQAKVSNYMGGKRKPEEKKQPPEIKSIKVPIPTFPPTAMVYSVPKSQTSSAHEENEPEGSVDIVSAAIMAKVLEERERERSCVKHCDTCTCSKQLKIIHNTTHHSIATQTNNTGALSSVQNDLLCLQCTNKMERPSIQIVKGVSNVDASKNKAMPVYIHDYESNATANYSANVAKVQPNNFLNDSSQSVANDTKFRKEGQTNKLDSSFRVASVTPIVAQTTDAVAEDLIALGTPTIVSNSGSEMIYFANERPHKKPHKIEAHDKIKTANCATQPTHFAQTKIQSSKNHHAQQQTTHKVYPQQQAKGEKSLLLKSCDNDFRQILVPTTDVTIPLAPVARTICTKVTQEYTASSLSSEDHSELTSTELTNSNSNYQKVEEWMDSINLNETATVGSTCGTDCSDMTNSIALEFKDDRKTNVTLDELKLPSKQKILTENINTTKYKEMEDHVKKFLLGEYTLLGDD